MAKEKEIKTNAMRILDKLKINYKVNFYECEEFIDGVHIADKLGQSYDSSFKTLVLCGKSKAYYVFALPVDKELDMKKGLKIALGIIGGIAAVYALIAILPRPNNFKEHNPMLKVEAPLLLVQWLMLKVS